VSAAGELEIVTVAGDCDDSGNPMIRLIVSNPTQSPVSTSVKLSLYKQYIESDKFELSKTALVAITIDTGVTKNIDYVFTASKEPEVRWIVAANEYKSPPFGPCFQFESPEPSPTRQPTPSPTGVVDCCPALSTPYPTATVVRTPTSLPTAGGDPNSNSNSRIDLIGVVIFGVLSTTFGLIIWLMNLRRQS